MYGTLFFLLHICRGFLMRSPILFVFFFLRLSGRVGVLKVMAVILPGNLGLEWDELLHLLELECGRWNAVKE